MASRKDYVAVADVLSGIKNEFGDKVDEDVFTRLILDFGAMFKRDNELFDLRRFEKAAREG